MRSATRFHAAAALLWLGLVPCAPAQDRTAAPPPSSTSDPALLRADEPRAFGHLVGDRIRRRIVVDAPAGSRLEEEALPRPVLTGQALELQQVHVTQRTAAGGLERLERLTRGGERFEIDLTYQVFHAPASVRTLELPPLQLRVRTPAREQELRVDAWPVSVAPLTPPEAVTREGLGDLRPDDPPPRAPLRPVRTRLAFYAGLATLALAYLAWVAFGWPGSKARQRPFHRAWRELRRLSPDASREQRRTAMQRLHLALNESAGQVLFAGDLPAFVRREPRFEALADDLAGFFQRSRHEFFDDADTGGDNRWLRTLARRLRDAERGLA